MDNLTEEQVVKMYTNNNRRQRIYNILAANDISLSDLQYIREQDIKLLRNMGRTAFQVLEEMMNKQGISFGTLSLKEFSKMKEEKKKITDKMLKDLYYGRAMQPSSLGQPTTLARIATALERIVDFLERRTGTTTNKQLFGDLI